MIAKNLWIILFASLFFLAACGENGAGPGVDPRDGNADAVEVRVSTSLGIWTSGADASTEGLSAQGVPVDPETGESGVAQAELEVFNAEGEQLFFKDAQPVSEGEGEPVIFTPRDNTLTLAIPPGTYTFFASATDEREPTNELARGLAENVQIRAGADNRVSLAFTSLLGQVTFDAPETVEANAVFDAFLAVSPPGRPDLRVSEGDYEVEYSVAEPSEQLSSSQIGVRVAAGCATTQVRATVSNQPPRGERTQLEAQTGISVSSDVCNEANVGTDLVPPYLYFTDLEDGDTLPLSLTLAGEANDRQSGIERVEVYEGTVKLGDAELGENGSLTTWRFDYAAEREGNFTFIAVAFDRAGNSSRAEVKVKVDKDDTSSQEVEIPDEILERTIRDELNKPQGTITQKDLASLNKLILEDPNYYGPAEAEAVRNLQGLQFAVNLERLDIPTDVEDLSPLSDLTKLTYLSLSRFGAEIYEGRVSDLSPLSNLTSLKSFDLANNNISDLTPLQNLSGLEFLLLTDNQISDLTPLQNLTKLESLTLDYNQIGDLSGLQPLTALEKLDLSVNQLGDIDLLVQNEGLGEGDELALRSNDALETCPGTEDRADIDTLTERGVKVYFDNPENCGGDGERIDIPDDRLESLIRGAIGKPEGDLTKQDLAEVTVIEFEGLRRDNLVETLEGLQFAVNLEELNIPFNSVEDLSPLRNLANLTRVNLTNTPVSDISPLVENENLGEGDSVGLVETQLELCPGEPDRENLDALIERGVSVGFEEPTDCEGVNDGSNDIITVNSSSGFASLEGACTLRAAITAANMDERVGGCPAGEGADTIALTAGKIYALSEVDNETGGPNALPAITSEITLEGNGAEVRRSSASGTPAFRLFYVAEEGSLSMDDVTLQNGGSEDILGGAILNAGTLDLLASTLQNNYSAFDNQGVATLTDNLITKNAGYPAGVFNDAEGDLTLRNTRIADQDEEAYGMENEGRLLMVGGELSGNSDSSCCSAFTNYKTGTATFDGTLITGNGGQNAIFINEGELAFVGVAYRGNSAGVSNTEAGTFTMTNSTVSGNGGFGIWNRGEATMTNSTVSGNGSQDDVVDLVNIRNYASGTLTAAYSTITQESYDPDDLSETALDNLVNEGGSVTVFGSVITNKLDGEACVGDIASQGYNLDGDGSCSFGGEGDLSSVDPLLGTLQDNGGPTFTHALQAGSPAIDAIPTDTCSAQTDQRGVSRPQGDACDIGAFEREQ